MARGKVTELNLVASVVMGEDFVPAGLGLSSLLPQVCCRILCSCLRRELLARFVGLREMLLLPLAVLLLAL